MTVTTDYQKRVLLPGARLADVVAAGRFIALFGCAIFATVTAFSQAFQNLGFESANLSPIPPGQFGGPVPSLDAIPGWRAFLGATQTAQVLQNNLTLGTASVDILGPNWSLGGIIQGQYSVALQPGLDPFGSGQNVGASISQSGLVPANAKSLQFKASTFGSFSVSLGGQNLPVIALGTGANYTLYGANISPLLAGQLETLAITASPGPSNPDYFDSFVFSPLSVPEPGAFSLLALGGVLGLLRSKHRRGSEPP